MFADNFKQYESEVSRRGACGRAEGAGKRLRSELPEWVGWKLPTHTAHLPSDCAFHHK